MSCSPQTKLAYIPVSHIPSYYNAKGVNVETWTPAERVVMDNGFETLTPKGESLFSDFTGPLGGLQARDPVSQKVVWFIPSSAALEGGVLSTAGNLVFQGRANGSFQARKADAGDLLWSADAQNGIASQPITYTAAGKQYVSVIAGFSGPATLIGNASAPVRLGISHTATARPDLHTGRHSISAACGQAGTRENPG